uniref:Helicase ATP-binding domain-containing protein n=1 Tax=Bursaphelenchus xylophilus TaxID=6326 RepID=A0A1I7SFZ6_BURXY
MRKSSQPSSFGGFSAPIIAGDGPNVDDAAGRRERDEFSNDEFSGGQADRYKNPRSSRFASNTAPKSYSRGGNRQQRRDSSPSSSRGPPPNNGYQRKEFQSRAQGGFSQPQNFGRSENRQDDDFYEAPQRKPSSGGFDRPRGGRSEYGSPTREFTSNRRFDNDEPRGSFSRRGGRAAPPPPYLPQGNYLDSRTDERLNTDFMRLCNVRQVDWSRQQLPQLEKDFYTESEAVKERSAEEMQDWIDEHQILLHGDNIPRPCFQFHEPGFPPAILELLQRVYDKPTLIQCISWPVALSGQDIVSIARTGSGKTLGFLLPAIVHTLNQPAKGDSHGPRVLVLLPTRELAQQACDVAKEYCAAVGLTVCAVFGGVPREQQV